MTTQFPSLSGERKWQVVDAEGQVLGRVAVQAAKLLMGKHKPAYATFLDNGDHVIVINAKKVRLTGQKLEKKVYRHHTGFPGGLVERRAAEVKSGRPDEMIRRAVEGMLPKTKLGKAMIRKLRVYSDEKHPHASQQPVAAAVR
jgi:large subunit ribosomal protein L13